MTWLKEGIDRIVGLAEDAVNKPVEIDGRKYWSVTGKPIMPPTVSPVSEVKSLDALLSAIEAPELKALTDDLLNNVQIVVASPSRVSIVSAPDNTWAQRERYIDAEWRGDGFPFGRYMELDEFVIKVQSQFVDGDDKAELVSQVSGVVAEESIEVGDNGVTQSVVKKDGMNRKGRQDMKAILELRPYRTFPELEQPKSKFLLRMKMDRGEPQAALFDADGGLWVSTAVRTIGEYIRNDERVKRSGIAVIG